MRIRVESKYDTSINWTTNNTLLLRGELGIESDTGYFKFGDGVNRWNSIPYAKAIIDLSSGSLVTDLEKSIWNDKYTKLETDNKIQEIVGAAPEALNTLSEIAIQLQNDESAASALTNLVSQKANISDVYNKTEVDTYLLSKANTSHTHSPNDINLDSTHRFITDTERSSWNNMIPISQKGAASGVASLEADSTITPSQLPINNYIITSNFTRNSSTLADISQWTFPVESGKYYYITILGLYRSSTANNGARLGVYLPSGSGNISGYLQGDISATAAATGLRVPISSIGTSNNTNSILTTGVSSTTISHYIGGYLFFICTSNGEFRCQWASETNGSTSTLMANSAMIVNRLN